MCADDIAFFLSREQTPPAAFGGLYARTLGPRTAMHSASPVFDQNRIARQDQSGRRRNVRCPWKANGLNMRATTNDKLEIRRHPDRESSRGSRSIAQLRLINRSGRAA